MSRAFARRAETHWAKYLPTEYLLMEDREEFFRRFGETIQEEILTLAALKAGDGTPDESYLERAARLNTARVEATSEVLREMLPEAEADRTE